MSTKHRKEEKKKKGHKGAYDVDAQASNCQTTQQVAQNVQVGPTDTCAPLAVQYGKIGVQYWHIL